MFDKLHIRTNEPVNEKALLGIGFVRHHGDNQYRRVYRLPLPKGNCVTVKTDSHWLSAKDSIEMNPSKFDSWLELNSILGSVAHEESMLIDRIDHAVDISVPYQKIWETVRIQRKQGRDKYQEVESERGGRLTGFKTGEKPEVFCIYDKSYECTKRFHFKPIPGEPKGVQTRIEARHTNKKVEFPYLKDIRKYLDYNPFEKVKCFELKHEYLSSERIMRLQRDIQLVGFKNIFRELNEHGNFHKVWGRFFEEKSLGEELGNIYQSRCEAFLGANSEAH